MNRILVVSLLLLPSAAPQDPAEIIDQINGAIEDLADIEGTVNDVIGQADAVVNDVNGIVNDATAEVENIINTATTEADNAANSIIDAGEGLFTDPENSFNEIQQCFSSRTTADVEGKGTVTMEDVQVGDRVLTSSGDYATIYSIDHRHPTKSTDFIQIHAMALEAPLELTPKHMLFVEGNSNPVPAASVKVGDQVQTLQGPARITKIDTVTRAGVFSPLTVDGTIVASGIIASSYSAFLSDDEWIEIAGMKIMSHQSFYDMALKPYRYICTGFSLELCKTSNEKIALSQFANDLYDHSSQYSQFYQKAMLSLVVLFVCIYNFVLSPYAVMLALPVIGKYSMKHFSKNSKLA